ncbi:MAG TPA: PIN domain-containing protein [Terriglobia bacterium]|nr:PIN domain-containing protein [Terriglobia bacterium]
MRGKDKAPPPPTKISAADLQAKEPNYLLDIVVVRLIFAITLTIVAYRTQPFGFEGPYAIGVGLLGALGIIFFEYRLRGATLKRLIGAAIGSILGIVGAALISHMLTDTIFDQNSLSFIKLFILLLMTYVGLVVGANKGDMLNLSAMGGIFGGERPAKKSYKILDTSVVIDGRIADICETGFLDGTLVIPHFVLRELQQVADSADSLKRNRGRRGLDILQRIQKMNGINVQLVENDYPQIREVDMKLIELAKELDGAKIVTNDFNLNKVAQLRGVEVLNINELANALKPVYLPGETMKVFILKEGKEFNQGIAYLDDGTMVVVDNARKMIGKTVESSVTSVLQTTAGKMIFGRYEEKRGEAPHHPGRDDRPDRNSHTEPRPERQAQTEVSH